jgi:hypothetical protein
MQRTPLPSFEKFSGQRNSQLIAFTTRSGRPSGDQTLGDSTNHFYLNEESSRVEQAYFDFSRGFVVFAGLR